MRGTSLFTSFEAKKLVNTYGAENKPIYFDNGVPTILSQIGSNTQPVYVAADGTITALTFTANRLYYSEEVEGAQDSTNFKATRHFSSESKLAVNNPLEPAQNFYVNGTARISLGTNTAISDQSFVLGTNAINHISIGNNGLQSYNSSDLASLLLINPYGGTIQVGDVDTVTAGNYYGRQTFKTVLGLNFEGIRATTTNNNRPVWFSDRELLGTPSYNTQIQYNPYTGFLIINPNQDSATGGIQATDGDLSIYGSNNIIVRHLSGYATIFKVNDTEALRINNSGKVIIGSTQQTHGWNGASLYVVDSAKIGNNLAADTITITNDSTAAHLTFSAAGDASNTASNYIIVPLSTQNTQLILASSTQNPHFIWTSSSYAPAADMTVTLGTRARKWSYLYLPTVRDNDLFGIEFISNSTTFGRIVSTTQTLELFGTAAIALQPNSSQSNKGVTFTAAAIEPFENASLTLGTPTLRWSAIYLGNGNAYGNNTNPIYWADGVPVSLTYTVNRLYYSASTFSFEHTNHFASPSKLAINWYVSNDTDDYNNTYTLYVNGTSFFNNDVSINGHIIPSISNRYTLGLKGTNHFTNVYVGTDISYGSDTNPIYWSDGVPVASNATIGTSTRPIYMTNGIFMPLNYTPNRLYYSASSTSFAETLHYSNKRALAINWYPETLAEGEELVDYNQAYTLYVNGTSYHNGADYHVGNIVPMQDNVYTLGENNYRWRTGFFETAINIGSPNFQNANSAAEGTFIEPGAIKLTHAVAPSINFNCGLATTNYHAQIITDIIGRLHFKYSANPTLTYNNRTVIVNLYNEGTFYNQGNIETNSQININGDRANVNTISGYYLKDNNIDYATLTISQLGTASTLGSATLTLGNSRNNEQHQAFGILRLYQNSSYYTEVQAQNSSANAFFYLPNYSGATYAIHAGDNNAIGSNDKRTDNVNIGNAQPIYIAANGRATVITNAIATAYGGTGNTTYTANRLLYAVSANYLDSSSIITDGSYLSNVSYLNINANTTTNDGTANGYRLYVNGTAYYANSITMRQDAIINYTFNKQLIKWSEEADIITNTLSSWYGMGVSANKLYIANASGMQLRTNSGQMIIQADNSSVNINSLTSTIGLSAKSGITFTAIDDETGTANPAIVIAFATAGSTNLRHNGNVLPNTGNSTGNVGSLTEPTFVQNGVITKVSYKLEASIIAGTAGETNLLPYYKNVNEIRSGTIHTNGTYLSNVGYLTINDNHQTSYRLRVNGNSYMTGNITIGDSFSSGSRMLAVKNTNADSAIEMRAIVEAGGRHGLWSSGYYKTESPAGYVANNKWLVMRNYGDGAVYFYGNADTATQLKTGREIYVNLAQARYANNATMPNGATYSTVYFDGSADKVIHVTGILQLGNGGTGITSNPSLLVNLASTNADNVFKATPRPGVTGKLPIANGGTNADNAATARANLGTWSLVSDSYNTFMPANGTTNGWYKFNTAADNGAHGILPSNSGGAGNGHSYIGTSSWYWKYAYIDQIYGYLNGSVSGDAGGNAASATKLKTSRKLWNNSFDGSSDINGSIQTSASARIESSSGALYIGHANDSDWVYISDCCSRQGSSKWKIYSGGEATFTKVYGAVWNDYAEYRTGDTIAGGYCVTETKEGIMRKTTERLQPGCKITSDTYGFAIGETNSAKTPIAISGRVLAYTTRNRDEYILGAAVCSGPNGTIDIMTRDEIITYPERIVGTVSEIPTYDIWYAGCDQHPIPVNGRIWIYVR